MLLPAVTLLHRNTNTTDKVHVIRDAEGASISTPRNLSCRLFTVRYSDIISRNEHEWF